MEGLNQNTFIEGIIGMNKKNVRTGVVVAVLLTGLLVGASFALAQDADDPPAAPVAAEESLEGITEEFEQDVAPLVDEIRERALAAIDDAVSADSLTQEQGEAAKERVEGYRLPEGFPFAPHHRFPWFDIEGFDAECFGFGTEGTEKPEDCPEFPMEFPFGDDGFRFGPMPDDFEEKWGHLSEELEGFIDGLDFDFEQLQELVESGLSPDEALAEMDVDLEEVLSGARDDAIDKIDELVADGTIPEDKADMIKEKLEGIDFSSGVPFGLQHFDFEMHDFDGFGPDGPGFFGDHHSDEDPDDA